MTAAGADRVAIGVDLGTTALKAVALDGDGRVRALRRSPMPTVVRDGVSWHDPEAVFAAACRLLARLVSDLPPEVAVAALAFASVAEEGALLDRAGRSLGPVPAWHNPLPAASARRLVAAGAARGRYAWTGLRSLSVSSLVHWHGLRAGRPALWRAASTWLSLDAYAAYRLCGVPAVVAGQAGRTGMYALTEGRWRPADLADLGKTDRFLPPVRPSGAALGPAQGAALPAAARRRLTGAMVATGGHDHPIGAWAAGVTRPDAVLCSLGTAGTLVQPCAAPSPDEAAWRAGITFGALPSGGPYFAMAATHHGAILATLARLSGRPSARALPWRAAARLEPQRLGIRFRLPPFGRPAVAERRLQALVAAAPSPAAALRAVVEAFADRARRDLAAVARAAGAAPVEVRAVGGGSREDLVLAALAARWRVTTLRLDLSEAVAAGAALAAWHSVGLTPPWRPAAQTVGAAPFSRPR